MSASFTGGCLCGAIRYRSTLPHRYAVHCHCRMCQRTSGAPFMTWVTTPRDGFSFIRGEPKVRQSSAGVKRAFCGDCGAQITMDCESASSLGISIGTLDEPENIASAIDNIWASSRLPVMKGFDAELVSHEEFSER